MPQAEAVDSVTTTYKEPTEMIDKIKALGLAFIAAAATSAVAASAAQASSLDLTKSPAVITAHSDPGTKHILTIPAPLFGNLQLSCPTASFEGTYAGALTQIIDLTVTATYGPECKTNGLAATVKMNGCKYTITGGAATAKGTALVDIVGCTQTKQIEIEQTATGCIVFIPEQNGLSHIVLDQTGTDATATTTLEKITNTQGAKCPNPGLEQQNASLAGETTVQAFEDTGQSVQDIEHGHQFNTIGHSQIQIAITVT